MENTNVPVISAKDLNLWYGDFKALKSISLDVGEREITALIGPSGCGKSTFLKTLNRMNDLIPGVRITGDVRYRDMDIYAPSTDVTALRRQIGMVFQKPNPFPMSVYDNIAYGPRTHGVKSRARLDEIVERSLRDAAIWDEVKDRLKKNALGLSGGQQQRLCIARALAKHPRILILDDSTSAVDLATEAEIQKGLRGAFGDMTVFIIAQRISSVMDADRILVMENGRVIDSGKHEELKKRCEVYREIVVSQLGEEAARA